MHILGFTECLCILRDYLEQINSNTLTAEMVLGVYTFKPAIYVHDWYIGQLMSLAAIGCT